MSFFERTKKPEVTKSQETDLFRAVFRTSYLCKQVAAIENGVCILYGKLKYSSFYIFRAIYSKIRISIMCGNRNKAGVHPTGEESAGAVFKLSPGAQSQILPIHTCQEELATVWGRGNTQPGLKRTAGG
jgi:hypothetical protein